MPRSARSLIICWLVAGAAGVAGAAQSQGNGAAPPPTEDYVIGVGDVLQVSVWKSPEFDATVPVRPDGHISLPLLGDMRVVGIKPVDLQGSLLRAYARYVTAPEVTVIVREIHSRKVFVTGEVESPGAYDLRPGMRVMQAVALAGGLTPYARDRVVVLRNGGGHEVRHEVRLDAILSGRRLEDNLLLQPGDTLIVP